MYFKIIIKKEAKVLIKEYKATLIDQHTYLKAQIILEENNNLEIMFSLKN